MKSRNYVEDEPKVWTFDELQKKLEEMLDKQPAKGTQEYRKHKNEYTKLAILYNQMRGMKIMREKL